MGLAGCGKGRLPPFRPRRDSPASVFLFNVTLIISIDEFTMLGQYASVYMRKGGSRRRC